VLFQCFAYACDVWCVVWCGLRTGTGSQRDLIESRSLNSEMVQEAEQEAEKQKDKRVQQYVCLPPLSLL